VDGLRQQFGDNLKAMRERAGLSQERLAQLADLDRTEVSLLERGKRMPRLDTIVSLARGLNLHAAGDLLNGIR
jgi:transcriptional regulator with XRE-family HTH domain